MLQSVADAPQSIPVPQMPRSLQGERRCLNVWCRTTYCHGMWLRDTVARCLAPPLSLPAQRRDHTKGQPAVNASSNATLTRTTKHESLRRQCTTYERGCGPQQHSVTAESAAATRIAAATRVTRVTASQYVHPSGVATMQRAPSLTHMTKFAPGGVPKENPSLRTDHDTDDSVAHPDPVMVRSRSPPHGSGGPSPTAAHDGAPGPDDLVFDPKLIAAIPSSKKHAQVVHRHPEGRWNATTTTRPAEDPLSNAAFERTLRLLGESAAQNGLAKPRPHHDRYPRPSSAVNSAPGHVKRGHSSRSLRRVGSASRARSDYTGGDDASHAHNFVHHDAPARGDVGGFASPYWKPHQAVSPDMKRPRSAAAVRREAYSASESVTGAGSPVAGFGPRPQSANATTGSRAPLTRAATAPTGAMRLGSNVGGSIGGDFVASPMSGSTAFQRKFLAGEDDSAAAVGSGAGAVRLLRSHTMPAGAMSKVFSPSTQRRVAGEFTRKDPAELLAHPAADPFMSKELRTGMGASVRVATSYVPKAAQAEHVFKSRDWNKSMQPPPMAVKLSNAAYIRQMGLKVMSAQPGAMSTSSAQNLWRLHVDAARKKKAAAAEPTF